jgi:hypothetical protein
MPTPRGISESDKLIYHTSSAHQRVPLFYEILLRTTITRIKLSWLYVTLLLKYLFVYLETIIMYQHDRKDILNGIYIFRCILLWIFSVKHI